MVRFLLIYVLLAILAGCSSVKTPNHEFSYLRHKGADMPVWVQGNLEADVFLIYLHGGPGGSSFIDLQNHFFAEIEQHYGMVYYDQRASGNAIGHSPDSLLTLEQFTEDLDVVVDYIQSTYHPAKIVLLGHSWGGTLGTAYLLQPERQAKIGAWIEVDGGHNLGPGAFAYSRDYVLEVAEEKIESGTDVPEWKKVQDFYASQDTWRDGDAIIAHSRYVTQANGYFYDAENRKGLVGLEQVLFSETDFLALLSQNKHVVQKMDVWHYDFTDRLQEIEVPKLLLWGISDGILPVELAYEAKEAMGLDEEHFHVFQSSGHSPHYEETELFNQWVIDFIEAEVE